MSMFISDAKSERLLKSLARSHFAPVAKDSPSFFAGTATEIYKGILEGAQDIDISGATSVFEYKPHPATKSILLTRKNLEFWGASPTV